MKESTFWGDADKRGSLEVGRVVVVEDVQLEAAAEEENLAVDHGRDDEDAVTV
jgi:hypothetical protein